MRPIHRCLLSVAGAAFILILVPIMVQADVPQLINFQGKLVEDDLAVTGFRTMTFSLWESDIGGSPANGIWSETQLSVEIVDGIYNVQLGSANSLPSDLYTYDQLYLQIDIIHPTEGSQRLSPLLEFTSTVYALKAGDADMLGGKIADAYAQNVHNHSGADITTGVVEDARIDNSIARDSEITWGNLDGIPAGFADGVDNTGITLETDPTVASSVKDGVSWSELSGIPVGFADGVDHTGIISETDPQVGSNTTNYSSKWNGAALVTGTIYDNGMDIGIGTISPIARLHVTTANNRAVHGSSTNTGYITNYGGYFEASAIYGRGVYGEATGTKGNGVYGVASGSEGSGVFGYATVMGDFINYGGYFRAEGRYGRGVYGEAMGANGNGVYGSVTGSAARAVFGRATNEGDGTNYGGYFEAKGTSGRGVYAWASGSEGRGVFGYATNSSDVTNYGGYFDASGSEGRGVYGVASNTGDFINYGGHFSAEGRYGRGVYGKTSGTNGNGVYGVASGSEGRGVYGTATDTGDVTNYGGYFEAEGTSGWGVYGRARGTSGTGVSGVALSTSGWGVHGVGGQYDFYAGGVGTNYGPFTGAHEVKFAQEFPENIRMGLIVSATGRAEIRKKENGEIALSSTLPTATLSIKAMDKAVLGVLVSESTLHEDHWYEAQAGERFGVVNALGEGRVLVTNVTGKIEAGDYITTSSIPGYGQKQDDDLLHSYTLGKAIETVDWDSVTETIEHNGVLHKVYLIAVVYTSG